MENDNPLAFLDTPVQDNAPAPAPEAPQAAPEAPPAAPERPRDDQGRFAAKAADEAPTAPEGETRQPPLTEKETVGFYKAMQEERDKRQAAEKRALELEARLQSQAPAPNLTPDQQSQVADYQRSFTMSRKFALKEIGAEKVAELEGWARAKCDADPAFNAKMLSSDDPFEAAKQAWDAEQVLARVKSPADLADYDEFKAWKAAQATRTAKTPDPSQQADDPPPRSLASAPGTGSRGAAHVEVGEKAAFDGIFGPR